jgi:hypothetical protein
MKTKIIFLSLFLSVSIFLSGFLLGSLVNPIHEKDKNDSEENIPDIYNSQCDNSNVTIECEDISEADKNILYKKLFYHRIILFGKDTNGETFSNTFYFIRQQKSSEQYSHTYTLLHLHGKTKRTLWTSEMQKDEEIQTDYYIPQFEIDKFEDLSTREEYIIQTKIDEITYDIDIKGIEGDFLVKNSPDYLRYVSSGTATVKPSNGSEFIVNAMVDQYIVYDYTISIFFEGREELVNTTHSLTLWDQDNNFYHLDITDVENDDLPYKTHRWILFKDFTTGGKFKAFEAELEFVQANNAPSRWIITVPDLDNKIIEIDATEFINNKKLDGTVSGRVYNSTGEKLISGQFLYDFQK